MSGGGSTGSGSHGSGGGTDPFRVGRGDNTAPVLDSRLVATSLMRLDGLLVWAVPSFALAVPGLLLLLAVLAQVLGAAAWLPVVRRKLGAFGFAGGRRT